MQDFAGGIFVRSVPHLIVEALDQCLRRWDHEPRTRITGTDGAKLCTAGGLCAKFFGLWRGASQSSGDARIQTETLPLESACQREQNMYIEFYWTRCQLPFERIRML
jgi:hypothetical protein